MFFADTKFDNFLCRRSRTGGDIFFQATFLYVATEFAICGVKAESELNIFLICGRGADAEQNFLESERSGSQKDETPSIFGI